MSETPGAVQNAAPPASEGGGGESWQSQIPQDLTYTVKDETGAEMTVPLSQHPKLAGFKDVGDLAKSWHNQEKMMGKRGLMPLPDTASDEERAAFNSQLNALAGVPDSPDGYQVDLSKLPDGMDPTQGYLGPMVEAMHKAGATPAVVQGMVDFLMETEAQATEELTKAHEKAFEQAVGDLKTEWGDGYDQNLERGERFLSAIATEEQIKVLEERGALSDPLINRILFQGAQKINEGHFRPGETEAGGLTKAKLREMKRDPRYHDPAQRDPDFVKQVEAGYDALYPGDQNASSEGRKQIR